MNLISQYIYTAKVTLGKKHDDLVFLEDNQRRKNYDDIDALGGLLLKGRRYGAKLASCPCSFQSSKGE